MLRTPRATDIAPALALAAAVFALAVTTRPAHADSAARAAYQINFLAGGSVYINAGLGDSVRVGDSLQVVRNGTTVALLRTTFVSTHRAVCDTLWTRAPLAVGDRFVLPRGLPASSTVAGSSLTDADSGGAVAASAAPVRIRNANAQRLRGRIGARWLSVNTSGGSFQQPALDFRFDATNAGASHVDLSVDTRSRRTTRSFTGTADETEFLSRVYRATLTVRSQNANRRITVGRQSSPTLASISLFDGALLELGGATHSFGLFSGTQPDPSGYGPSTDVVESGLFAEWHQRPLSLRRWSVALGGVTSQDKGQSNRDFLFAQSWWYSKTFNASLAQELDVNHGWKRDAGEAPLSMTSTYANLRLPLRQSFALTGGYDNRRNVRLYRDRLTPETEFDDAYRQGAWCGAQSLITSHVHLSVEARNNAGADRSHSWSTSAELYRLVPLHTTLRVRASNYSGGSIESTLRSGSLGFDPLPMSHIEVSGGVRSTSNPLLAGEDREYWQTIDYDVTIGRSWYINGGWERDYGGSAGGTRQLQAGLSWSF